MKKFGFYLSIIILSFGFLIGSASASEMGIINDNVVRLRKGSSTASAIILNMNTGATVNILETVNTNKSGCDSEKWYKVNYETNTGYVCSDFVNVQTVNINDSASKDFESTLKAAGFPESYWNSLKALHKQHPNWVFKTLKTGFTFQQASDKESKTGVSLIQGSEGYRSTNSKVYNYYTNKWTPLDGSNWYAANSQTVEFYLDPRNWLAENTIFMFEDLSYNSSFHTEKMVKNILSPTKLGNYDSNYSTHFMSAAKSYKVSPVYLASRVRQEVGSSTLVISGTSFTYNGNSYSKLYNPYNIGATSGSDNWKKGLVWANGGQKGSDLSTSYLRPWNSLEKAIKGGANYIASGYINNKQNTNYLQKFNVGNGLSKVGSHQYMTNIQAPSSEAKSTYKAYKDYGILNESLVFLIPVYNNMPSKTTLPNSGNPNNYLKTLQVDGTNVPNFSGGTQSYTLYVSEKTSSVNITASKVVNSGSISGTGKLNLTSATTVKDIVVTAGDGSKRTYKITFIKSANVKQSVPTIVSKAGYSVSGGNITGISVGTLNSTVTSKINNNGGNVSIKNSGNKGDKSLTATGDEITVSNGAETKTYTVILKGDADGDGKVSSRDYMKIKNEIMRNIKITGYYRLAADVNGDGNITSVDYVNIKNYIMGKKTIIR